MRKVQLLFYQIDSQLELHTEPLLPEAIIIILDFNHKNYQTNITVMKKLPPTMAHTAYRNSL